MFINNWKKEVFTIPNLLSLFRLALIPVYMPIYLNANQPREYVTAGALLALSCFTDLIDGFIVSNNVQVNLLETDDRGFICADHNPVRLQVTLMP